MTTRILAVLVGASILLGCGGAMVQQTPTRPCLRGLSPADIPQQGWLLLDAKSGCEVDPAVIKERLASSRFVYVGEAHDQPDHHRFQAWVVEVLAETGLDISVGFEMFKPSQQPVLDAFSAGEIPVETFPEAVDWKGSWGMDFGLYQPIIEEGLRSNVRLVGLNARRDLASKVYKVGLEGLEDSERAELPPLIDDSNDVYRAWVTQALLAHFPEGEVPNDIPDWQAQQQRFFEAQLVWDETMAANTVAAARSQGGGVVVVVVGAGHVRHGWGIPDRVQRTEGESQLILVCTVLDGSVPVELEIDPDAADYYCVTRDRAAARDMR